MKCPTCGKELRALQIEMMIGNPDCNEWCRNGYCSLDCFDRKDPDDKLIEVRERPQTGENPQGSRKPVPASKLREFDSYTLSTACLLAVPFSMLIGAIGNFTGAYQVPQAAFGFFILICLILVAGLVSGVVALFGIRKHGREGILLKSLIGILLIIGCAALLISDIINARTKRTEAEVVPPNGSQASQFHPKFLSIARVGGLTVSQ